MVGHRLKLRFVGKRFLINGHTLKAAKWDFVKLNQQIGVKKALLQIETSLLLQSSHLDSESLTPPLITCLSNNMLRQNNLRNLEPFNFNTLLLHTMISIFCRGKQRNISHFSCSIKYKVLRKLEKVRLETFWSDDTSKKVHEFAQKTKKET